MQYTHQLFSYLDTSYWFSFITTKYWQENLNVAGFSKHLSSRGIFFYRKWMVLFGVSVCFIKVVLLRTNKHPDASCCQPCRWIVITLATLVCVYTKCKAIAWDCSDLVLSPLINPGHALSPQSVTASASHEPAWRSQVVVNECYDAVGSEISDSSPVHSHGVWLIQASTCSS